MRLFLILALLGLHAGLLLDGAWPNFVCIDEVSHIPAGLSHGRTGSFRHYRVNPPLPRVLVALPLLAAPPTSKHAAAPNPASAAVKAVPPQAIRPGSNPGGAGA